MKLFLISGFLGSGKTTAIKQASLELLKKKTTVAAITNDQGIQLVDSQFLESFNIPTQEVNGGCFCCNYENLDANIHTLIIEHDPNVIFAESVGSCTDLISTIVNPLGKFRPDQPVVISTFADARILPVLIKEKSHFFDDGVHYIYEKQLKEADVLVVNKTDLVSRDELTEVKQIVEKRYPDKIILYQNSLDQTDVRRWLTVLNDCQPTVKRKSIDINYSIYGAGEARLGWLDAEFEIRSNSDNAVEATYEFLNDIFATIRRKKLPIGHLKFLLKSGNEQRKISFTTSNERVVVPDSGELNTNNISMLINARVQAEPEHLKKIIAESVNFTEVANDCNIVEKSLSAFQPEFPKPTHRIMD